MSVSGRARFGGPVRVASLVVAVGVTATIAVTTLLRDEPEVTAAAESTQAPTTPAPSTSPTPSPTPTVPDAGDGTFTTSDATGSAGERGQLIRYRVDVEDGLGVEADDFARAVRGTLHDDRSWTGDGDYRFELTPSADLRVVLASPDTTDELCAPLNTGGEVSCRNGNDVVINARRWALSVPHVPDLQQYRDYVVNHEMGHALGFGHVPCGGEGEKAPVMAQQTLGLDGCEPNAWP